MNRKENKSHLLPENIKSAIDQWTVKFPADRSQSAVLPALMIVQAYNQGWLSNDLIEAVADYLNMPRVAAVEVATFYSLYDLKPTGRYKISVCTNLPCMLSGCEAIVKRLQERLNIKLGETTPDNKITLKAVECLGACANAPVIHLDNRYHENLTPQSVDELLDALD